MCPEILQKRLAGKFCKLLQYFIVTDLKAFLQIGLGILFVDSLLKPVLSVGLQAIEQSAVMRSKANRKDLTDQLPLYSIVFETLPDPLGTGALLGSLSA